MIVGIPKEIKNNEYRVSLTPAGAMELVRRGHTVYIQSGAGVDSGFADKEYQAVGAKLLPTIEEVYDGRDDYQGQGADRTGVRVGSSGTAAFHLFPFRQQRGAHAGDDRVGRRVLRLRDGRTQRPFAAAADPHVGGRGPHGRAGGALLPRKAARRQGNPAGRRAGREAGQGLRHRRGRGRYGGGAHGGRYGRRRHDLRRLAAAAYLSGGRDAPECQDAHVVRVQHPRGAQTRRSGGRVGADSGRQGAEAGDARHVETDGAGYGHGRRRV